MRDPRAQVDQMMQVLKPALEKLGIDVKTYYTGLLQRKEWALELERYVQEKLGRKT